MTANQKWPISSPSQKTMLRGRAPCRGSSARAGPRWLRCTCSWLFVWPGVVEGALLCGRPRRVAPADSRVPYTVTTSRSTSGQHTAAPKRNIFSERYDFANTQPTAVAAGHSRQRAGIRARRPSESSLDVRCQLLPGCNPPALPCFPQALQQGDRARPNYSDEAVGMYTIESRASPRSLQGGGLAPLRALLPP